MRLTNLREYGRLINPKTNRAVNLWTGRNPKRGTDHLFYYYRSQRIYVGWGELSAWRKEKGEQDESQGVGREKGRPIPGLGQRSVDRRGVENDTEQSEDAVEDST